ncbi:hypothetical protein D9611_000573 [Ephemerocybe angulata]|uniref:Uncharacterized protein n=1 Tax=Ephemerocybe angulata TaxID=980116 RepID=A0A8H5F7V9_9AGAR|nr:hypothetical protein D9611_000573 [Tulosesus angulatus]
MSAAANPTSGAYRDRSKDPDVDLEKGIGVREDDVQVVERQPTASSSSPSKPSPITTTAAPPSSNNRASKSSSKRTSNSSQKRDSTKPSKRHSKTHRRTGSSTPSLASPRGSKHLPPRSPLSSTPPPSPPANDDNASLSSLTPSQVPPINVTKYTMSRRLSPYWSTKRGYATIAAIALLFVGVIVGAAVGGVLSNRADQKAGDKEAEASSAAESASASGALQTGSVGRRGYEAGRDRCLSSRLRHRVGGLCDP